MKSKKRQALHPTVQGLEPREALSGYTVPVPPPDPISPPPPSGGVILTPPSIIPVINPAGRTQ